MRLTEIGRAFEEPIALVSAYLTRWRIEGEDDGVAVPLVMPHQKGQIQLAIKDVVMGERRYVLYRDLLQVETLFRDAKLNLNR